MVTSGTKTIAPGRWALEIPAPRIGSAPIRLTGSRPTCHSIAYFGALAGVARIVLMLCGPTSLSTIVLVYAGCLVGAPVAATVIPARGERLSRLFCGVLGSAALALSNLAPALVHPMPAPHGPWSLAIPGAAAAVVVLVNLAGLALCRWFPDTAPRRHRNTHP